MTASEQRRIARLLIVAFVFTAGVVMGGVFASSLLMGLALILMLALLVGVLVLVGRSVTAEIEAARAEGVIRDDL